MTNPITLHRPRIFRETPSVRFHDISVEGSNGIDLVEHHGQATSPPNTRYGLKQWYYHKHQTDNNRVIKGQRLFELFILAGVALTGSSSLTRPQGHWRFHHVAITAL